MTDGSSEQPKTTAGLDIGDKYSYLCLIDSLRLFSESPAILHLFGARRLSQQDYPSFPEP